MDNDIHHIGLSHFSLALIHRWGYKPNDWHLIPNEYWGNYSEIDILPSFILGEGNEQVEK